MAKPRSPNRDKAYQLWLKSDKKRKLKDIAVELQVSEEQVRKWKNQDKWDKVTLPNMNSNVTIDKDNKNKNNKTAVDEVIQEVNNTDLTDKQQLFCMFFAMGDSATSAYQKAYSCSYRTAMVSACRMLRNVKVKTVIEQLKQERFSAQMFGEHDIFQWYLDVALANITDFVSFGREEAPVIGMKGPVLDKETGEPVMREINYVKFKESSEVNGHLIKKVKLGKDGASIELYDAMKAMEWLTEHMSMGTDTQQGLANMIMQAYDQHLRQADKERKIAEEAEENESYS